MVKRYYGLHCCFAIVESRSSEVERVFIAKEMVPICEQLIAWCDTKRIPYKIAASSELSRIAATEHHEGIVVEAKPVKVESLSGILKTFKPRKESVVVFLDGVENPHNLGAAMRTCAFFGVDALIASAKEMKELPAASCRVAEGAAEDLPIVLVSTRTDVIGACKGAGYKVYATTPHGGESLFRTKWPGKVVLMFGAEGPGLSASALAGADAKICIPRHESARIESLNVASAVAVCVAECKGR